MTKYDGIKAVDTRLNNNNEVHIIKRDKPKKESTVFLRWLAAGVFLCGVFGLKYLDSPVASTVTGFVKDAVTFEMVETNSARGEAGSFKLVELIKEFLDDLSAEKAGSEGTENG